ncbi:MAG: peptidylprolyl isomerase [Rickettsiales bacterium]|jgi:hypothetical protein|nr:peptidylprolyl isomerase [Rickettsiales bacterium]
MNVEKFKKSGVKCLIVALIVILILSSINGILLMSNRYNIIVSRNKKLSINGFIKELNEEKRKAYSLQLTDGQLAFLNSRNFMVNLVSQIADSSAFELEIENFCIREPDELVLKRISEEERFKESIEDGMAKFNDFLKKENITEEEYMDRIRGSDNLKYLLNTVSQIHSLNNLGVDLVFHGENLYKNIKLFSIEGNNLKSYRGEVNDSEMRRYYNNNIHKFVVPDTKKIEYVTLTKYLGSVLGKERLGKIRSLLSSVKNIEEFARATDSKVETLGYLNREVLMADEKYASIVDVFDLAINSFSWLRKIGDDIQVYSVTDAKKGYTKSFEEVKDDIILAVKDEKTRELRRNVIQRYIDEYRNKNFDDKTLIDHGFKPKKINHVSRKYEGYGQDFIEQILTRKTGETTDIFFSDGNVIYFAVIGKTGEFGEKDGKYVGRDRIGNSTSDDINKTLLKSYTEYLRDKKYKIKVKYNLLDLIKLN